MSAAMPRRTLFLGCGIETKPKAKSRTRNRNRKRNNEADEAEAEVEGERGRGVGWHGRCRGLAGRLRLRNYVHHAQRGREKRRAREHSVNGNML